MWPLIHAAERTMEELVARYPDAEGEMLELLNQTARELLLLESSDWPFLVTTGQAKAYAVSRFQGHLARFNHLVSIARRGFLTEEDRRFLRQAEELDNPFPTVDYRVFREREQVERKT
jgi:1,4-alpha-glucan branching enzyme